MRKDIFDPIKKIKLGLGPYNSFLQAKAEGVETKLFIILDSAFGIARSRFQRRKLG